MNLPFVFISPLIMAAIVGFFWWGRRFLLHELHLIKAYTKKEILELIIFSPIAFYQVDYNKMLSGSAVMVVFVVKVVFIVV